MKIVAIFGGLGSQMFKYSFYLRIKDEFPEEQCLIDTTPCDVYKQWNGYELNRVFGINERDFRECFSSDRIKKLKNINQYRIFIINKLRPRESDFCYYYRGIGYTGSASIKHYLICENIKSLLRYTLPHELRTKLYAKYNKREGQDHNEDIYIDNNFSNKSSAYFDEFMHGDDKYLAKPKKRLVKVFSFRPFDDTHNIELSVEMMKNEAVSIHVRRGDHLSDNKSLIENGYYLRAVDYLKHKYSGLKYYIFSDDCKWCFENVDKVGLDIDKDDVVVVDWNTGIESYRDMQLMTLCKYHIIAISSFGWWGQYLSEREGKVVCSPAGYWQGTIQI